MSETGIEEATTGRGGLIDEAGNRLDRAQSEPKVESLVRFAREQPLTTALGAFVLGYILGKLY